MKIHAFRRGLGFEVTQAGTSEEEAKIPHLMALMKLMMERCDETMLVSSDVFSAIIFQNKCKNQYRLHHKYGKTV